MKIEIIWDQGDSYKIKYLIYKSEPWTQSLASEVLQVQH